MEINQKLFDECTQNYTREREVEKERSREKQAKWLNLEQQAQRSMQVGHQSSLHTNISLFVSVFSHFVRWSISKMTFNNV